MATQTSPPAAPEAGVALLLSLSVTDKFCCWACVDLRFCRFRSGSCGRIAVRPSICQVTPLSGGRRVDRSWIASVLGFRQVPDVKRADKSHMIRLGGERECKKKADKTTSDGIGLPKTQIWLLFGGDGGMCKGF